MDTNLVVSILATTAIIFLAIGVSLGLLIASLRMPPKDSGAMRNRNMEEVFRVWRGERDGPLNLEVNGKIYPSRGELNVSIRDRLVKVSDELHLWLGAPVQHLPTISDTNLADSKLDRSVAITPEANKQEPVQAIPQTDTQEPVVKTTTETTIGSEDNLPQTVRIVGPAALTRGEQLATPPANKVVVPPAKTLELPPNGTQVSGVADQPAKSKFLNPIDVIVRAISSDVPKDVAAPKSIAAQIDEILQEKLEISPLKDRGIRLMELPEKGLVVMVGTDEFDAVSDVPDPEVRDLLKECVTEWEKRSSAS